MQPVDTHMHTNVHTIAQPPTCDVQVYMQLDMYTIYLCDTHYVSSTPFLRLATVQNRQVELAYLAYLQHILVEDEYVVNYPMTIRVNLHFDIGEHLAGLALRDLDVYEVLTRHYKHRIHYTGDVIYHKFERYP
jgi:hypothetical protein